MQLTNLILHFHSKKEDRKLMVVFFVFSGGIASNWNKTPPFVLFCRVGMQGRAPLRRSRRGPAAACQEGTGSDRVVGRIGMSMRYIVDMRQRALDGRGKSSNEWQSKLLLQLSV